MKEATREMLKSALFEAIFVVFGVVAALMANDWRGEQALRHHSKIAMGQILDELRANREAVAEARDYHQNLVEQIAANPDMAWEENPFRRGFIAPAQTSRSAWESAAATGAFEHRDFQQLLLLARVYASQERYEQQATNSGAIIYQEIYKAGIRSIFDNRHNLAALIRSLVYREQQLLDGYDQTLANLESAPAQIN